MEADGNFIYDPPAGFTGNDTFTYTVNDNDPETPANQTDTATVTIASRRPARVVRRHRRRRPTGRAGRPLAQPVQLARPADHRRHR